MQDYSLRDLVINNCELFQGIEAKSQSLKVVHPNALLISKGVVAAGAWRDSIAIARETAAMEVTTVPLGFGWTSGRGVFCHNMIEQWELEDVESKRFLGKLR